MCAEVSSEPHKHSYLESQSSDLPGSSRAQAKLEAKTSLAPTDSG